MLSRCRFPLYLVPAGADGSGSICFNVGFLDDDAAILNIYVVSLCDALELTSAAARESMWWVGSGDLPGDTACAENPCEGLTG